MSTHKHPTDALLAQYAAGDIGEGVSLAIAAHLTYCPKCRAKVAEYEAMFGGVMASEPAAPEAPPADLLAQLDAPDTTPAEDIAPTRTVAQGPLPRAIAEKVGVDFDAIPWKFRLPGVMEYEFIDRDGEKASLLKVRPGASVPQHTHEADELTVVFDGLLEDGGASYGIGDFAVADHTVDHHPQAGGDRTCICLAVLTGGLTFTGRFGRALNLFS